MPPLLILLHGMVLNELSAGRIAMIFMEGSGEETAG
jgi:hypothetical protein